MDETRRPEDAKPNTNSAAPTRAASATPEPAAAATAAESGKGAQTQPRAAESTILRVPAVAAATPHPNASKGAASAESAGKGTAASKGSAATVEPVDKTHLPPLLHDRAYWGMLVTQFLGAFNDNVFRQMIMLRSLKPDSDEQGPALIIFALPFVLFSGICGWISDRISKRTLVVGCKAAEIAIMVLGAFGFWLNHDGFLLFVLFLMGAQSAVFGPPKYGMLPEMFRKTDLPRANGLMLMTTFLAIIFGLVVGSGLYQGFKGTIWIGGLVCVVIAVIGTWSSLYLRETPVAAQGTPFHPAVLLMHPDTFRFIWRDGLIFSTLCAVSAFYLVSGMIYPAAINALGKEQLGQGELWTGIMSAHTGIGIAIGCVIAGRLTRGMVRGWLIQTGAIGMIVGLTLLALPAGTLARGQVGPESTLLGYWGGALMLGVVGLFAGFFSAPIQVFLQARTPEDQRGRIYGAVNLFNFVAIAAAGVVYTLTDRLLETLVVKRNLIFAAAALLMLLIALAFRPPTLVLKDDDESHS